MATLYEIADEYRQLLGLAEYIAGADVTDTEREAMKESFESQIGDIKQAFEEKAENIAVWVKNLEADSAALGAEIKVLTERKKRKEAQAEWFKEYLFQQMQELGKDKLETVRADIRIKNNPKSVTISDEAALIDWAEKNCEEILKYKQPEISKSEIKKLLKIGKEIPYTTFESKQVISIK